MMLALSLIFRAWTAPPATADQTDNSITIPIAIRLDPADDVVVVNTTVPSDPHAIELLKGIAPKEKGDGSCYVEFERDLEDPVWQTKDRSPVRYFFVRGVESQFHVTAGTYPEHLCWKDKELRHFKPKESSLNIYTSGGLIVTDTTPHRWLIASLAIDPDMEFLTEKACITILKDDDKLTTIRLISREKIEYSLSKFGEHFTAALSFDPEYALREADSIDVEISKKENKVKSIRVVEPTKQIVTYRLQRHSMDRAGIEQSLASTPLKVPEGWKTNRIPMAEPANQH